MKKFLIGILVCAVLAVSVVAQSKSAFSKDPRLVAQWFTDNANTQKFIEWAGENLSQEQIDSLQSLMFPDPEKGQKQVTLELMKLELQRMNMEKEGAENKPLYDAVSTALDSARAEAKGNTK